MLLLGSHVVNVMSVLVGVVHMYTRTCKQDMLHGTTQGLEFCNCRVNTKWIMYVVAIWTPDGLNMPRTHTSAEF